MPEVFFDGRYAIHSVRNPSTAWLRDLILDPNHLGQDFGEATIKFQDGDRNALLILIADRELGYYLNYSSSGDTWLSVGDASRLGEVVCPDDWQASAGLFVAHEKAWLAIHEFCLSGGRTSEIAWMRPEDMPAEGNW